MRLTRRGLQVALGLIWLVDAGLQFQPYMFSDHFANDLLAGAATGQPFWVADGVRWAAQLISAAPVLANTLFALTQLGLGAGLLWRPTARLALAASVAWSLGVWYFAEALGGLASGHASLLTGFPGAVLLYAVLAVAAWPGRDARSDTRPPSSLVLGAWVALWAVGAIFQSLLGQSTGHDLAATIAAAGGGAPGWLASLDHTVAGWIAGSGQVGPLAVVLLEFGIATTALGSKRTARTGALLGVLAAAAIWVIGEGFGQIYTEQATDPNSGLLLLLMAIAVFAATTRLGLAARSGFGLILRAGPDFPTSGIATALHERKGHAAGGPAGP